MGLLRWDDMEATKTETGAIRAYAEGQAEEAVVHLEKAASEMVGPVRHDIWDVHCSDSRWWVVTNPTMLYSQADLEAATSCSPSTSGSRFGFCTSRSGEYQSPRSQRCFFPGPGVAGSRRSRRTTVGMRRRTSRRWAFGYASASWRLLGRRVATTSSRIEKRLRSGETSRTGRSYSRTASQPAGARTSCGPTSRSWPWRPGNT